MINGVTNILRSTRRRTESAARALLFLIFSVLVCIGAGARGASQTTQEEDRKPKNPAQAAANYFPNNVLLTQDNIQVHFFDDLLKGKAVVINFMFTTCTGVCPPMTANLAKVQSLLGERVGKDINMISVTVDPAIDTPDVLKKYATKFNVRPGWYFLTGKKTDLDTVLKKLGGYVEDKNQHNTILIIGNVETGEWMKVFAMSKPSEIAERILKVSGGKKD